MQKQVSKQSLAIVALSILLAISMALTATFAAFADSKTVSGTITFTPENLAIVLTGNEDAIEESVAIIDVAVTFESGVAALSWTTTAQGKTELVSFAIQNPSKLADYYAGVKLTIGNQQTNATYTIATPNGYTADENNPTAGAAGAYIWNAHVTNGGGIAAVEIDDILTGITIGNAGLVMNQGQAVTVSLTLEVIAGSTAADGNFARS